MIGTDQDVLTSSEGVDTLDADEHAVAGAVVDELGAALVGGDRPVPSVVGLPVVHGGGWAEDAEVSYFPAERAVTVGHGSRTRLRGLREAALAHDVITRGQRGVRCHGA